MTAIQDNLQSSNETYSKSFDKGHLALPPAKKYLVGKLLLPCIFGLSQSDEESLVWMRGSIRLLRLGLNLEMHM